MILQKVLKISKKENLVFNNRAEIFCCFTRKEENKFKDRVNPKGFFGAGN